MSEPHQNPYAGDDFDSGELRKQIAKDMGRGAGVAAALVIGVVGFVLVIKAVGSLLPPESKEAVDPSLGEFSSIVIAEPARDRVG